MIVWRRLTMEMRIASFAASVLLMFVLAMFTTSAAQSQSAGLMSNHSIVDKPMLHYFAHRGANTPPVVRVDPATTDEDKLVSGNAFANDIDSPVRAADVPINPVNTPPTVSS
jgi:hypothetical protein